MTKPLTALAITAIVLGSALGINSDASAADAKRIQPGRPPGMVPDFTASGPRTGSASTPTHSRPPIAPCRSVRR